jgi:Flp pilus assembly protein TadD
MRQKLDRKTLQLREKVLGKEHPNTLHSMNNLTLVLDKQGKYDEAEKLHRQTLPLRENLLGKEHPDTLHSMNNLAGVLYAQGKYNEAEKMFRETLQLRKRCWVKRIQKCSQHE